jgi:peptidoglycan/xylan/chitin deacetylase (PgdA/CDA1 family)
MLDRWRLRPGVSGVPVLLYHGLTTERSCDAAVRDQKYWVPATRFREHLNAIRAGGYEARLLHELWASPNTLTGIDRSVVITFDDGNASDYRLAVPALAERGMRAEFFLNTAAIGADGLLTWRDIREMQQAGMSFQSHSHDHVDLARLPLQALERQLLESKRILEDRLASRVHFVAVPYGRLSQQVVDVARQAGYTAVGTSWPWPARPGALTVSRVAIYRRTTDRDFVRLLARDVVPYAARVTRAALVSWPKRVLLRWRPSSLGVRVLEKHA